MEMTKSEKLLKKNEKKIFGDFFRYDVIQERAWLVLEIFQKNQRVGHFCSTQIK